MAENIVIFGESLPKIISYINEDIVRLKIRIKDQEIEISHLKGKIQRLERECLFKK